VDTDRNLLFGVLALQADLIDADHFARACSDWAATKATPLADLLQERGWISGEDRSHVEFLLERKLRKYGGDARASLAAATDDRVRSLIAAAEDDELRRSVTALPRLGGHTLLSTVDYQPESRERYTLTHLHAKGGLGQVWLALDGDLGRRVALKELRPERADRPELVARFLEEARITGQLEHPGIVPVYELARRSADGQPFYTMRFVKGRTLAEVIRDYHRKREAGRAGPLDLIALLDAFVGVCNAVAYAHSRGVIHRDLKPQNVVLGDYGEVVVLDWGLAKLVDRPEGSGALESVALDGAAGREGTVQGQVLGTPAYMAPEQAEGRLDRVDHRSDAYGLGAILYETLAGRPPFEGADTLDVLRRVVHEPPPRPRDAVPATPRALEAVCLKALSKRPEDRYDSARTLADEVRHYLADEPVSAFPEPLAARAGRWMRRHRTLVSGAAILLVTAAAAAGPGLVLLGRKNREIAVERNVARAAADQAQAINDFLTEDLLGQADPDVSDREKKVTVEELLHRAAGRIDGNPKFAARPEVEATLRLTIGKTFFKLSDLREAERHLRRAAVLRSPALGPDDPRTLAAQEALADFLNRGPGRFAEAEPLARQTWRARARVLGPDHRDTLDSLDTYASALSGAGRVDESITLSRECLAARRRVLGAGHPDTLSSMNNLAYFLTNHGRWAEAIPLAREVLASYGDRGPETDYAASATNLASALYLNGDLEEADRMLGQAVDRATRRLGAEDLRTASLRGWRVRVWIELGRVGPAVDLGRDVLAAKRRRYPAGHPSIGYSLADLGWGLVLMGRSAEAEPLLAESRALFAQAPPPMEHYPAWAECWQGAALAGLRRYEEAEPHLLAAEEKLGEVSTALRWHRRAALEQLVKLYEAWDKPELAERWRKKLPGTR
jgi:tetratricopeptide (TPR) repeat protein/tRNA A-37 threonylcarbamoyl transferase component Bud32